MTVSENSRDMAAVIEVAQQAIEPNPIDLDKTYSVVVPDDHSVKIIDHEERLPEPNRKRGDVTFWDAPSMASYVNKHKSDQTSLYMSDEHDSYIVVAVLNGHSEEFTGWGDHRATLVMRKDEAWERWRKHNDRLHGQEEFAEHIERNLVDIVDPPGADLLELAQTFQAKTNVVFRTSKRLSDGQRQFEYVEDVDARGGTKGELTIPKEFTLGIAPFVGSADFKVRARLRYRLDSGRLTLGYVLDNPNDVERTAFVAVVEDLGEATQMQPLYGKPSPSAS